MRPAARRRRWPPRGRCWASGAGFYGPRCRGCSAWRARSHKAWRYRDRDADFTGVEVAQGFGAQARSTVPYRVWAGRDFPQWLIFFVTARCNARCSMCFYWEEIENASQARELPIEEVRSVARSLPKMTYLSLSGGEPYLRDDLEEVVQAIVDTADPVFVSIPTNGAFPERVVKAMDALTRRNPGTNFDVHLSLDGPPAVHDRFHLVPLHGNYKDRSMSVSHERFLELAEKAFRPGDV